MRNILGFIALIFIFQSCSNTSENIDMKSLNGKWTKDKQEVFDFEINTSEQNKDVFLIVRNNDDYPYSNIRFFVELTNIKTKKTTIDTLNYPLAKPNGEWLGSGFGSTKEILFQYKMNYQFPNTGKYKIGIKQAMRRDTLVGIEDIGLKIENTKM